MEFQTVEVMEREAGKYLLGTDADGGRCYCFRETEHTVLVTCGRTAAEALGRMLMGLGCAAGLYAAEH